MVYALAAKLAPSVSDNVNMTQIMMLERDKARSIAMYVDSQNSPSVPIQSIPWIDVRFGNLGYWNGTTGDGWGGWGY